MMSIERNRQELGTGAASPDVRYRRAAHFGKGLRCAAADSCIIRLGLGSNRVLDSRAVSVCEDAEAKPLGSTPSTSSGVYAPFPTTNRFPTSSTWPAKASSRRGLRPQKRISALRRGAVPSR